jgi:hypothetical protein
MADTRQASSRLSAPKLPTIVLERRPCVPEHQEFGVGLQPVVGKRSRRAAWVATAVVPFGLVCVVALGWFGGDRTQGRADEAAPAPPTPALGSAATTALAGSAEATPRGATESGLAPTPDATAPPERVAMADFGYDVVSDPSAIGPPVVEQDGQVVVFRSGAWLVPDGVVAVGIGTPSHAGRIFGSDGSVRVYGATLAELERSFRLTSRDRVVSTTSILVDGVPAQLLAVESFPPEIRSVVLVVRDNRSYVIAAWGFSSLYPGSLTNATRSGLAEFLQRFHFLDGTARAGQS